MAFDPRDILRGNSPPASAPPSPLAGTREQRIQRLQVGFLGVAAMVMVVSLADIIMSTAESNQAATAENLEPVTAEDVPPPPPSDPLVEAGVVPDIPAEPEVIETEEAEALPLPIEDGDVPPPNVIVE